VQVVLNNVPKNAGQKAFYVFSISPLAGSLAGSVDTAKIFFPSGFSQQLGAEGGDGSDFACGYMQASTFDNSWFDYKSLLALTTASANTQINFVPVAQCQVAEPWVLSIPLSGAAYNASLWTHFVLSNVLNPPAYDASDAFQVALQGGSQGAPATQWFFRQHLVYFVSPAPQFLTLDGIQTASGDIRTPTNYSLTLRSVSRSNFAALANLSLLVSVRLPLQYYAPVLPYQALQQLACWTQLGGDTYYADCTLYGSELLMYGLRLSSGATLTSPTYVLNVQNLVNPLASFCAPPFFDIRLIDAIAREVVQQVSLQLS
jgi:hypothetical protein